MATDLHPMRPLRRGAPVAALAVALGLLLAGCTAPVPVPVADDAADPVCARVVLALPDELPVGERRTTSSQATVAWGEEDPVILRCGVPPPPPTTERCVAVTSPDGTSVDWISVQDEESGTWTFTTYGRDPAVEVQVPEGQASSMLIDIGSAVAHSPASRTCL